MRALSTWKMSEIFPIRPIINSTENIWHLNPHLLTYKIGLLGCSSRLLLERQIWRLGGTEFFKILFCVLDLPCGFTIDRRILQGESLIIQNLTNYIASNIEQIFKSHFRLFQPGFAKRRQEAMLWHHLASDWFFRLVPPQPMYTID